MLKVHIPSVTRKGKLHIPVTDFRNHRDELILNVLPKEETLIITKFGTPRFKIKQCKLFEKVDFPLAGQADRLVAPVSGGIGFLRMSDFFRHMDDSLELLNRSGVGRLVVTWNGWPDFVVLKTRLGKRVEFERVTPNRWEHVDTLRKEEKSESVEQDGNSDDGVIPLRRDAG